MMVMLQNIFSSKTLLSGAVVSVVLGAAPSQAFGTITFNTTTSTNSPSRVFSSPVSSTSLTLSNSNSTGNTPGTINTNSNGWCAFTVVGTSGGSAGRCGYGTSPASGVSSFQLSLNKSSIITGFNVSSFETANISQGTVGFSTDNISFTNINFNGNGLQSLSFFAGANQPIFVRTSAAFQPSSNTGIFRIASLTVADASVPVPGPLPIFGVAAAFGWARKLRQRTLA